MGQFNATIDQVVQETASNVVGKVPDSTNPGPYGTRTVPAFWQNLIYYSGTQDFLKVFRLLNGQISATAVTQTPTLYSYPGPVPTISANGTTNGIVWTLQTDLYGAPAGPGPEVLHAYDAANISRELYNSSQAGSRDTTGPSVKFTVPTIANGKVFAGAYLELDVFGLLP